MRRFAFSILTLAWLAVVLVGGIKLWAYESAAGTPALAPSTLPSSPQISVNPNTPTLLMLIHPQCPCSRASIGELARIMTACNGKLTATVLFVRPEGEPDGWERTDLWTSAAAIPGVHVATDELGKESQRFGADTSGETLLYSAEGRLLFSGGITESRGHSGDNAGESAIIALVTGTQISSSPPTAHTPVYGCSLANPANTCTTQGDATCPR